MLGVWDVGVYLVSSQKSEVTLLCHVTVKHNFFFLMIFFNSTKITCNKIYYLYLCTTSLMPSSQSNETGSQSCQVTSKELFKALDIL